MNVPYCGSIFICAPSPADCNNPIQLVGQGLRARSTKAQRHGHIRFRSARRSALVTALALGAFVLLIVPTYSALVADPSVLADEQYLIPACGYPLPFPVIPEPVCPYLFAGESPLTVLYSLIVVPILLLRNGARTMLVVTVLSLLLALIQVLGVFVTFPSALDPGFYPSPLRREVGCGLVRLGPHPIPLRPVHSPAYLSVLRLSGVPDDRKRIGRRWRTSRAGPIPKSEAVQLNIISSRCRTSQIVV